VFAALSVKRVLGMARSQVGQEVLLLPHTAIRALALAISYPTPDAPT
jgi:hypothetical protein